MAASSAAHPANSETSHIGTVPVLASSGPASVLAGHSALVQSSWGLVRMLCDQGYSVLNHLGVSKLWLGLS